MYEEQTTVRERASATRVGLRMEYALHAPHAALFASLVESRGLAHVRGARWNTASASLDELAEWATHSGSFKWGCSGLFDLASESGCHAFVLLDDGIVSVHLAAGSVAALDAGEAFVRARVPELQPTDDPEVPVTFWCYGSCGAQASTRTIAVPSWADIGPNYPLRVAAQLERLMSPAFRPASGGQLVLWYGEPGTGKTYALRALAWEWRSWCSFNYITDPETFFGPHTDYMLDVLVDEEPERWQLLILEDTGELLGADAKTQTGQGLSRLLNVVDGILGQGLRVLVLVTTNDDLRRLHPAVSRPGRCLAGVEFAGFTREEADAWFSRNGIEGEAREGTLAGLYAQASGEASPPERHPIGFTR